MIPSYYHAPNTSEESMPMAVTTDSLWRKSKGVRMTGAGCRRALRRCRHGRAAGAGRCSSALE